MEEEEEEGSIPETRLKDRDFPPYLDQDEHEWEGAFWRWPTRLIATS